MEIHGDLDLNQNKLKQVALDELSEFPVDPVVGEFCFKSKIVYICTQVFEEVPTWIPLTNELMVYIHTQSTAEVVWQVNHQLGKDCIIQVIDADNKVMIPDTIQNVSVNAATITFKNAQQGRAICVAADNSGGIHTVTAHIHEQNDLEADWTINHGLGYIPIVQVVLDDDFQIIPKDVEHPDLDTTIVRFTSAQRGSARLI